MNHSPYFKLASLEEAKALIANPSDTVIAMNIGYKPQGLTLFLLNEKNQHFESYLIPEEAAPQEALTKAKERHYTAFNEVQVYLKPGYAMTDRLGKGPFWVQTKGR